MRSYYLQTLIASLISLLGLLIIVSCKTKNTPEVRHQSAFVPESEQTEQVSISVDKAYLVDKQKTINLAIKVVGKGKIACIQDFRLKAKFLEEQAFDSSIAYENAINQREIVTHISKTLKDFKDVTTKATASTKKQLTIPIKLTLIPASQATKLTLEIELLDQQNTMLHKLKVVWRKGKLLVSNIDELVEDKIGSFILKNATNNTFDANKIELTLLSPHGTICQFTKTNTSTATLSQLLKNDDHLLRADMITEPIALKLTKVSKCKNIKNGIKLIITQKPEKETLVIHKIPCKYIAFNPSPTEATQEASKAHVKELASRRQEQEDASSEEATTRSQNEESEQEFNKKNQEWDSRRTNGQECSSEKDGEKQPEHTSSKASDNYKPAQQTRSKENIEDEKGNKQVTDRQPSLHSEEDKQEAPVVTAGLDTTQDSIPAQEKHIPLSTGQNGIDITHDSIARANAMPTNHELDKPLRAQPTQSATEQDLNNNKPKQIENIKQYEEREEKLESKVSQQQHKLNNYSEDKGSSLNYMPDLQLDINQKLDQHGEPTKIFDVIVHNKGQELNKQALCNVILKYDIKGEGNLANAKLVRRGNKVVINGASLGSLLNSKLAAGEEESFQLLIKSREAESLHIEIFLEGVKNANTALVTWKKKEKIKQHKHESTIIPDLELGLDKRDDETNKIFNLWLKNKGQKLNKAALNNIKINYTISGGGNLADAKLTRRKRKRQTPDIQGESLGNLLNMGLEANEEKKFQLIIDSANADSLIIQINLEGVRTINIVPVNWNKKERTKRLSK